MRIARHLLVSEFEARRAHLKSLAQTPKKIPKVDPLKGLEFRFRVHYICVGYHLGVPIFWILFRGLGQLKDLNSLQAKELHF